MKEIAAALIEAQKELPLVLGKDGEGIVREGKKRKYLTLENIIETARPILNKHGLTLSQSGAMADGKFVCETTILHISGEAWRGIWPVLEAQDNKLHPGQRMGIGWTYARRYSLAAILGIAEGEKDLDASAPVEEPPPAEPPREMTDQERERFIAKVESLAGDVESACKITSLADARKMVEWLESRKQA